MRKLLLATTAVVGASIGMAGFAAAQTPYPLDGTIVSPRNAGHASTYGNNNYLNGEQGKGPVANPTPGTMVVHLGFLVLSEAAASWSSADSAVPNQKVSPIGFETYVRIYPGVDAMAANGLRYGAAVELRQNFFTGASSETGSSGGTTMSTAQTVFVRREFVYVAAEKLGVIRFGETDGVIGTFDEGGATTGVFLSPSGTIVGGDLQGTTVGGWMAPYFGAQSGNEYATEKLFYDSPSFFGFDIAAEYAPQAFNEFGISNTQPGLASYASVANGGFVRISSSSADYASSLQKNIYAIGLRYSGHVGPASVLAYGVYMGSGHVNDTSALSAGHIRFKDLSLGMFGANVGFAGFQVFGNVMVGNFNGVLGLQPEGAPNATGLGAGVKYAFGPWTVGGVYSQYDSQGSIAYVGLGQNHSSVAYLAATYSAAPGLTFYADYGYGQTYQGGGAPGTGHGQTQAFLLGTAVSW